MEHTESNREEALLPCPFCGEAAESHDGRPYGIASAHCTKCRADMEADSEEAAIAAWNGRQSAPQQEPIGYVDTELLRRYLADKHIKGRPIGPKFYAADGIDDSVGMTALYTAHPAAPDVVSEDRTETAKAWLSQYKSPPGPDGVFIPHSIFRNLSYFVRQEIDAAMQSAQENGE